MGESFTSIPVTFRLGEDFGEDDDWIDFVWAPKPDISVYELALAIPHMLEGKTAVGRSTYNAMPEPMRRHFRRREWEVSASDNIIARFD